MKVLYIGGTGIISSACVRRSVALGHDVFLLRRGLSSSYEAPDGTQTILGDIQGELGPLKEALDGHEFDVVCDFLAFTPEDLQRTVALLAGRCGQLVFVSSASAYGKPSRGIFVDEKTPLRNDHWQYSRDKIDAEAYLNGQSEISWTIVRPSLTYGQANIPLVLGSWKHPWTLAKRIREGRPVIVPGDGESLWSMTCNDDFALGFCGLLGNPRALGEAFQIVNEESLTWNQIFQQAGMALGREPNVVHIASDWLVRFRPEWEGTLLGDKSRSVMHTTDKIRWLMRGVVPEYWPRTTWAEGVARSVAWFDADPSRQTLDPNYEASYDAALEKYLQGMP